MIPKLYPVHTAGSYTYGYNRKAHGWEVYGPDGELKDRSGDSMMCSIHARNADLALREGRIYFTVDREKANVAQ